jgi:hypothetical protein
VIKFITTDMDEAYPSLLFWLGLLAFQTTWTSVCVFSLGLFRKKKPRERKLQGRLLVRLHLLARLSLDSNNDTSVTLKMSRPHSDQLSLFGWSSPRTVWLEVI